jgi:hypothetical protein
MPDLTASQRSATTDSEKASESDVPRPRRLLLEALRERDRRLARIYDSVIHLIGDAEIPDRLSLAAHAMRELMEKLPLAFDVPSDQSRLFSRIDALENALARAERNSTCRTVDGWSGTLDSPLINVLTAAEKLIEDRRQFRPSRTESAVQLMHRLEPSMTRRSTPLVKSDADIWHETRKYFELVSHHHHLFKTFETSASEFGDRVRVIEVLLLDKLRPTTSADYEEIDRLMNDFMGKANE